MSFWDRWMGDGGGSDAVLAEFPSPDEERDLVLYKYDGCGYCYRVKRALDRMDNVELKVRDTIRDPGARDELRSQTGRTQVPCLFIDGQPLFESLDIIAWLEKYNQRAA